MDAAWEAGITLFDTADAYGGGRSELWIGNWLRRKGPDVRAGLRICTKVFHSVEGDPRDEGLSRERVLRQIDGSLSRLGVECVDLYLAHEPDPETPVEETLAAFEELVHAGKVRAFGPSNVDADDSSMPRSAPRARPRRVLQNSYSLLDREAEPEVLPLCERHGVAFTAFGPLAGGWLTGQVPARRQSAARLADDAPARALSPLRRRADAPRAREPARRGRRSAASTCRRSPPPGFSPTHGWTR